MLRHNHHARPTGGRARRVVTLGVSLALVALGAVAALGGLATARTARPAVAAANNSALHESILVDANGRTLYELAPETAHHLLCHTSQCLGFWPPLKTTARAKLTKGRGVSGRLGRIHRNGFWQVTLNGRPLYRFAGDSGRGQTHGQGLQTFGGTWHVVKASAARSTGSAGGTTTTTTTSTTTSSMYSLPGY
jgi:predicted lipoprotein with Yx(FWY)xxD motif